MRAGGRRYIVYPNRSMKFRVWNISDIHYLNKACAVRRLQKDINEIRDDPNAFWFGGGDYADFIGYSDKRFDPDAVAEHVTVADLGRLGFVGMTAIRDLFKPIAHKCLGLMIGNHEKRYELKTEHEGLHHWLCTELNVPDLGYCCLFDLIFVRCTCDGVKLVDRNPNNLDSRTSYKFRIFGHHGAGYAATPGGKLNRLIQFMDSFDADIYFCGHVHDQLGKKIVTMTADQECKTITERVKLGMISGSYLKTYCQDTCTYGEQRGYRPTFLGSAMVTIEPDKRITKGEV